MPPKQSNPNKSRIRAARRKRTERAPMSSNQIATANSTERHKAAESRMRESSEHRDERLRLRRERSRMAREQHVSRCRAQDQERQQISRALTLTSFFRLAFEYSPDINYSANSKIAIGAMDQICRYCQAFKFHNEPLGMYCSSGKVVLLPLFSPLEPLQSLLAGESDDSKLFLRMTRKFNSCFQMTSFGATKVCDLSSDGRNFESTFKIQGQVYHKIGSLMPIPNKEPKFLKIYFMGSSEERVNTRCLYNFIEQAAQRAIVELFEIFLENHNQLTQLFKRVSPQLRNDNLQIVIRADKTPSGEHAGRFNAPTVEEVAIIMVGDAVDNRAIKITRRDSTVHVISDLHRLYDVLQYPLIFWQGQDGYQININQVIRQIKRTAQCVTTRTG